MKRAVMKHLDSTFLGFLVLAIAASTAFAFGLQEPTAGAGPGGAAPSPAGNIAAPGAGGNVDSGTLNSGANVTVLRGGREYGQRDYGRGAYYRGWGALGAGAAAGAEPVSAAPASANESGYHYYRSPYYNGTCWNPYYQRYSISFAPCAAYAQ
jgi:hypothetical protein